MPTYFLIMLLAVAGSLELDSILKSIKRIESHLGIESENNIQEDCKE